MVGMANIRSPFQQKESKTVDTSRICLSPTTVSGELTCSICFENFVSPRTLPLCLHTFCEDCLFKVFIRVSNDIEPVYQCPVCRKVVEPPPYGRVTRNWIKDFPVNHVINTLLSGLKQKEQNFQEEEGISSEPCSLCDALKTTEFCFNCHEYMCKKCSELHRHFKITKQHKTISVNGMENFEKQVIELSKCSFCPVHKDKKVEFLCKSDDKPLCVVCATVDHRACEKIISIDDHIRENGLSDLARTKVTDLNEMKTKLEAHKSLLIKNKEAVKDNLRQIVQSVSDKTKEAIIKLHDFEKKAIADSNLLERRIADSINESLQQCKALEPTIEEAVAKLNVATKFGSETQVFITMNKLKTEIEQLYKTMSEGHTIVKIYSLIFNEPKSLQKFLQECDQGRPLIRTKKVDLKTESMEGRFDIAEKSDLWGKLDESPNQIKNHQDENVQTITGTVASGSQSALLSLAEGEGLNIMNIPILKVNAEKIHDPSSSLPHEPFVAGQRTVCTLASSSEDNMSALSSVSAARKDSISATSKESPFMDFSLNASASASHTDLNINTLTSASTGICQSTQLPCTDSEVECVSSKTAKPSGFPMNLNPTSTASKSDSQYTFFAANIEKNRALASTMAALSSHSSSMSNATFVFPRFSPDTMLSFSKSVSKSSASMLLQKNVPSSVSFSVINSAVAPSKALSQKKSKFYFRQYNTGYNFQPTTLVKFSPQSTFKVPSDFRFDNSLAPAGPFTAAKSTPRSNSKTTAQPKPLALPTSEHGSLTTECNLSLSATALSGKALSKAATKSLSQSVTASYGGSFTQTVTPVITASGWSLSSSVAPTGSLFQPHAAAFGSTTSVLGWPQMQSTARASEGSVFQASAAASGGVISQPSIAASVGSSSQLTTAVGGFFSQPSTGVFTGSVGQPASVASGMSLSQKSPAMSRGLLSKTSTISPIGSMSQPTSASREFFSQPSTAASGVSFQPATAASEMSLSQTSPAISAGSLSKTSTIASERPVSLPTTATSEMLLSQASNHVSRGLLSKTSTAVSLGPVSQQTTGASGISVSQTSTATPGMSLSKTSTATSQLSTATSRGYFSQAPTRTLEESEPTTAANGGTLSKTASAESVRPVSQPVFSASGGAVSKKLTLTPRESLSRPASASSGGSLYEADNAESEGSLGQSTTTVSGGALSKQTSETLVSSTLEGTFSQLIKNAVNEVSETAFVAQSVVLESKLDESAGGKGTKMFADVSIPRKGTSPFTHKHPSTSNEWLLFSDDQQTKINSKHHFATTSRHRNVLSKQKLISKNSAHQSVARNGKANNVTSASSGGVCPAEASESPLGEKSAGPLPIVPQSQTSVFKGWETMKKAEDDQRFQCDVPSDFSFFSGTGEVKSPFGLQTDKTKSFTWEGAAKKLFGASSETEENKTKEDATHKTE